MGNIQTSVLSDDERSRLDEKLHRLESNVRITYKSHFVSSSYYGSLAQGLELLVTTLIPPSTAGLAFSINVRATKQAHIAVFSLLGIVFCGFQKFESGHSKYHPAIKQEAHFKAGIGLSAFHSEIIAFRHLRIRDPTLTRKQFMDEYAVLIEKKRRCDEIIQSDTWAYVKARNMDETFTKLWKSPKSPKNDEQNQTQGK